MIEQRAHKRPAVGQKEYEAKSAERQGQSDEGKKPCGPDPEPTSSAPKGCNQASLTDEVSRMMPASRGGFEQRCRLRIAVDTQKTLVAAVLDKVQALPEALGQVSSLLLTPATAAPQTSWSAK
jgi:hypothetical protein